jgi:hypothetical protein
MVAILNIIINSCARKFGPVKPAIACSAVIGPTFTVLIKILFLSNKFSNSFQAAGNSSKTCLIIQMLW